MIITQGTPSPVRGVQTLTYVGDTPEEAPAKPFLNQGLRLMGVGLLVYGVTKKDKFFRNVGIVGILASFIP